MSQLELILNSENTIGIVNHTPGTPNASIVKLLDQHRGGKNILVVDYPLFSGSRGDIEGQLPDWIKVVDHHGGYNGACETATAGVVDSLDKLRGAGFNSENTVLVTGQSNFDPDGVLSMLAFSNPEFSREYVDLIKQVARFSDNTAFGGRVFDQSYSAQEHYEKIAFALLQRIYEATVQGFNDHVTPFGEVPAVNILKGFPAADFNGTERAVLDGYITVLKEVETMFKNITSGRTNYDGAVEAFVQRLKDVNYEASKRGEKYLNGKFIYFDLTPEEGGPLDKNGAPFWLAEGYGKWTKGARFVLTKTGMGYNLASADQGPDQLDNPYPLTQVSDKLTWQNQDLWVGKDTILFGPKGENKLKLNPDDIVRIVEETYSLR